MKNIVGIAFDIPSTDDDYIRLDDNVSLSDYDIAIFSPDLDFTSFYLDSEGYEGKTLYDKSSSANIIDLTKHWKKEIKSFLENGNTLFVNLKQKNEFFVYSGSKSFSGTGRSQQTTIHVQTHSNYDFIPFQKDIQNASGKIINSESPLISQFYDEFKDFINYEAYIIEDDSNKLFTTRNKDKILGSYSKAFKGYLVFLPYINFNVKSLLQENKETEEEEWNKKALQIGKRFIQSLVEIDKSIRKDTSKTPKPSWANNNEFSLKEAEKTLKLIHTNKKKITALEAKNKELNEIFIKQESLKDLLFETGKPLEHAVINALQILGYQAENYQDGILELDQVITSPEKIRYIGECEGKDRKDIDVSKFRQLQDSLNEDFERAEVEEKAFGLLFGNPHRLIAPTDRSIGFTTKCLKGADREKIGLIRTSDLFKACKYILETEDDEFKKKCITSIHEQLGKVIIFPEIE